MSTPESVLYFWFGELCEQWTREDRNRLWFTSNGAFDEQIRDEFGAALKQASQGLLDDWAQTAEGALALILVLDQFSRCVHRATAGAFACDPRAQAHAEQALAQDMDQQLALVQRQFMYMPLMHSEQLSHQKLSVQLCSSLLEALPPSRKERGENILLHAREHHDLVARFGRFPHRNKILGRKSTAQELDWLKHHGKGYGQG